MWSFREPLHQALMAFLCCFAVVGGCATDDASEIREEIDRLYVPAGLDTNSLQLAKGNLKRFVNDHEDRGKLVQDAFQVIDGLIFFAEQKYDLAQHVWRSIIVDGEGDFTNLALAYWLMGASHLTSGSAKVTGDRTIVLAQNLQGINNALFAKRGFGNSQIWRKFLNEVVTHYPLRSARLASLIPLESKLAECPIREPGEQSKNCMSDIDSHFRQLQTEWTQQLYADADHGAVITAGRNAVKVARSTGDREKMAWAYDRYFQLLNRKIGKKDNFAMLTERINITLWSARYEALMGRFTEAKSRVDASLNVMGDLYSGERNLSESEKAELLVYRAEAALILAQRIFVEQKQYLKAYQVVNQMVDVAGLREDWRLRLLWHTGLYAYLDGHYEQANGHWRRLMAEDLKQKYSDKVLFWLAKIADIQGLGNQADAYARKLVEEHPYSFYSVVGLMESGLLKQKKTLDEDPETVGGRVKLAGSELGKLAGIKELKNLRLKVELLLAARLYELAGEVAEILAKKVNKKLAPQERHKEEYIYLAKLLFLSGRQVSAVRQSRLIYVALTYSEKRALKPLLFATPFKQIFNEVATDTGVPASLLWAIARQESLFNERAVSPAQAYGLMQVILPTAKKFGGEDVRQEQLFEPRLNITIGARYLHFLRSYFPSHPYLVYAAYNAGEFVVEIWSKRRIWRDRMLTIEMIPFSETRKYVQNVWRNQKIYKELASEQVQLADMVALPY